MKDERVRGIKESLSIPIHVGFILSFLYPSAFPTVFGSNSLKQFSIANCQRRICKPHPYTQASGRHSAPTVTASTLSRRPPTKQAQCIPRMDIISSSGSESSLNIMKENSDSITATTISLASPQSTASAGSTKSSSPKIKELAMAEPERGRRSNAIERLNRRLPIVQSEHCKLTLLHR